MKIDLKNIDFTEEEIAEIVAKYSKPNVEYPLFKRSQVNGVIVKFNCLTGGRVVWKGSSKLSIGDYSDDFICHTDTAAWEDVAYDRERGLFDGQIIECWDDENTHDRIIRFYDAVNKCTFNHYGVRKGFLYKNFKALDHKFYQEWMIEAYKTLEK